MADACREQVLLNVHYLVLLDMQDLCAAWCHHEHACMETMRRYVAKG